MLCRKRDIETESFYRMMDSYMHLQRIDRDHELVGLARLDEDRDEFTFSDKFNEMFVRNKKGGIIRMNIRYKRALDEAAKAYNSMPLDAA